MFSLGQLFMFGGCAGLVFYVWGYYIGCRDTLRQLKPRKSNDN